MSSFQDKTVGIVGIGTMGQGIALCCAMAGVKVLIFDSIDSQLEASLTQIEANLDSLVTKGKASAEQRNEALASIHTVSSMKELRADVVIEAIVEDLSAKQNVIAELELGSPESLILTNTSSISIAQLAKGMRYPARFAGLHFFNPAYAMKLVEIIRGPLTSGATIDQLKEFATVLNKQFVMVQDSPGFIVNRVARLFYVEALKLLEEGVSDVETIDELIKNAGFRMGPFELMDLIGIDVNLAVTKSLYQAFHQEPKFRPSRIQQQKVDSGMLGRKSGKGFYDYESK